MIALVYLSQATVEFDEQALKQLLAQSRETNRQHQVTGMLLYKEGEFFQVLEGEESQVMAVFNRIKQDNRHNNIEAIFKQEIEERFFPFWAMGRCSPDNFIETKENPLTNMKYDKVSIYKLLKAFSSGAL